MAHDPEKEKRLAANEAVKLIRNGHIIGLGSGSTAAYAVKAIGEMLRNGLDIRGIPTSNRTKELAASMGIPMVDINSVDSIDITIDGADEFTSGLLLIKGGGGALLREKIVASITKQEIIIADSSKKVDQLGRFRLPVEVVPFAAAYVLRQLRSLNGQGQTRLISGKPFLTDQDNHIIDADFGLIADPVLLSKKLNEIEGIVAHGLFINLAHKIIMGNDDSVIVFEPAK